MSCVAEAKASSQNMARLNCTKPGAGRLSATAASVTPTSSCSVTIHQRLVRSRSTSGDHSGLITQGRYSQLV